MVLKTPFLIRTSSRTAYVRPTPSPTPSPSPTATPSRAPSPSPTPQLTLLMAFTSPTEGTVVGIGLDLAVQYSSSSVFASNAELLLVGPSSSTVFSVLLAIVNNVFVGGGSFRVTIPSNTALGAYFIRVRAASISSFADTPTFRVAGIETRVETVEYDPDVISSIADRMRAIPGYSSVGLSVQVLETTPAASSGSPARSRLQAATVTHTWALPVSASSIITFMSTMQTLTPGDALLSGIYFVQSGADARANLAYVFAGGSSLVHYTRQSSGSFVERTVSSTGLSQPSACMRLGSSLLVGSRAPGLFVVSVSATGLEAKSVALPSTNSKPIVLAARAPLSKAIAGVFLQSDETSAGKGSCNAGGGEVALHVLDESGGLSSVSGRLRGVCPRALAVSPDSSSAVVLSTDGRLFRCALRSGSKDGAACSEIKAGGRSPLASGETIAQIAFLQSRAYLVAATLGHPSGPRLCIVSSDGEVEESTLLSVADALPAAASAAAAASSIALAAVPEAPAVYLAFGTVRILGPGASEITIDLQQSLSIPYITGGLVSGVEISILNPVTLLPIYSFVSASSAGLVNSRRSARLSLDPPTFSTGGRYAVRACVLDEASERSCSPIPSTAYFSIKSKTGSTTAEAKVLPFSIASSISEGAGSALAVGKLRAIIDNVAVGPPKRGAGTTNVSPVDAGRVSAPYDAVLEMTWGGEENALKSSKSKSKLKSGSAQGLYLRLARNPTSGRWLLVNVTMLDTSGTGVSWLPSAADVASASFSGSAALGEEIACGRLRVPLSSGTPAVERGWVELLDFSLSAFSSPASARSYGCGATQTCQLQQATVADGALAASCAPAEATTVTVRADLSATSIKDLLQQASDAAGAPVTVAESGSTSSSASASRRRLLQTISASSSTLALTTGSGPSGGEAAVKLANAVNSGSSSVSLLQGVSVAGSDEIFNPSSAASGFWTPVASASVRYDHACASGTSIYLVKADAAASELSVTVFSPATGTYTSGGKISTPGGGLSGSFACSDVRIYVFGGLASGAPTSVLGAYSIVDGVWTVITPPSGIAPPARSSAALVSIDDTHLLLAAGTGADSAALTDVWLFDSVASEWAQLQAPSGYVRYGSSAVSTGSVVFVFGGASQAGAGATFYNSIISFEVDTASTSLPSSTLLSNAGTSSSAPSPRAFALMELSVADTLSRIYVLGGFESTGQPASTSDLFIFDVGANVWAKVTPAGTAPSGLSRTATAAYGAALYVSATSGIFAWSMDGVAAFPSASRMMGDATLAALPQVTYPVSSTVILRGGSASASWVSSTATYTTAAVTLFAADRSRTVSVFSGANAGSCRLDIPSTFGAGSYRIQVVLSGPTVPVPLSLVSEAFTVIEPVSALEAVVEEVLVLAPTTEAEKLLGEEVYVEWTTRNMALQQRVVLSFVDTSGSAAEFTAATLQSTTSIGSATLRTEGIPAGVYSIRVSVSASNKTLTAASATVALRPYTVSVLGPKASENWLIGELRSVSVQTTDPRSVASFATVSLLTYPDMTPLRTIAPALSLAPVTLRRHLSAVAGDFVWNISSSLEPGTYILRVRFA
eukprot:tig00020952_g16476.t1